MHLLIIGGAGFIGSHMLLYLKEKKVNVKILDNLSTGYRDSLVYGEFIYGDLSDQSFLDNLFSSIKFDAVIHFAASIEVGESLINPSKYYENNLVNTINLLNSMIRYKVLKLIFSSTAAIYGTPLYSPIDELHSKLPINPYGKSKLMVENILEDFDFAYGLKSVCLRYFNAAGADPEGRVGESHNPETHLIPLVLKAANKKTNHIKIYGNEYKTPDGTCIRDYIHVLDLVKAHWLALESLFSSQESRQYNLGNGNGFSVLEIIKTAEIVTGRKIPYKFTQARSGDPAILISDSKKIKEELGWVAIYPDLKSIITHAWHWEIESV
jgi:UDP-glucose 4-epimerase